MAMLMASLRPLRIYLGHVIKSNIYMKTQFSGGESYFNYNIGFAKLFRNFVDLFSVT